MVPQYENSFTTPKWLPVTCQTVCTVLSLTVIVAFYLLACVTIALWCLQIQVVAWGLTLLHLATLDSSTGHAWKCISEQSPPWLVELVEHLPLSSANTNAVASAAWSYWLAMLPVGLESLYWYTYALASKRMPPQTSDPLDRPREDGTSAIDNALDLLEQSTKVTEPARKPVPHPFAPLIDFEDPIVTTLRSPPPEVAAVAATTNHETGINVWTTSSAQVAAPVDSNIHSHHEQHHKQHQGYVQAMRIAGTKETDQVIRRRGRQQVQRYTSPQLRDIGHHITSKSPTVDKASAQRSG